MIAGGSLNFAEMKKQVNSVCCVKIETKEDKYNWITDVLMDRTKIASWDMGGESLQSYAERIGYFDEYPEMRQYI